MHFDLEAYKKAKQLAIAKAKSLYDINKVREFEQKRTAIKTAARKSGGCGCGGRKKNQ